MKKIFLLSGSRAGSHYISTLYNSAFFANHFPELLNSQHWKKDGKEYVDKLCKKNKIGKIYNKENIFKILDNENQFITKYYTGYEEISPQEILDYAIEHNIDFYFLYRKNNIESLISFLYMHYHGKPTNARLTKAANNVMHNNQKLRETYNFFKPYIKNIITYEELTFTVNDLKLLGIYNSPQHTVSITPKSVSKEDKEKITKKDLSRYITRNEFYE